MSGEEEREPIVFLTIAIDLQELPFTSVITFISSKGLVTIVCFSATLVVPQAEVRVALTFQVPYSTE